MSNPYTKRACALMKWREGEEPFANIPLPPTPLASAEAQVNATLALAYEQRTANLIAAATAQYADGSAMFASLMGVDGDGLISEIKERLDQS
ncbi:hypothetical protein SEA_PUREGLOBE5_66 [Arthrobacter phage Pureglobe5]|nr:hypothetical protein SEA_PUREGLOBE5_66 [Arthrobacter phage Pureglobe5]